MRRFLPLLAIAAIQCLPGWDSPANAQIRFTPDHEVVQAMAEKAAAFLGTMEGRRTGKDSSGEVTLAALTIVEVNKRYRGEIPVDNRLVQTAVTRILEELASNGGDSLLKDNSMYYPALACILLCEVNDVEFAAEIRRIVDFISNRQNEFGGWGYEHSPAISDTSQSQYACLALFIANHHGFSVNPQVGAKALTFLTTYQNQSGSWFYHYSGPGVASGGGGQQGRRETLSLHCSGLGTVYLLADLLKLSPRAKNMTGTGKDTGLPVSVSIYVKPKPGEEEQDDPDKPLVNFDKGQLTSTKARGNRWFASNFTINSNSWNTYYLYALERYAFFREQSEGAVGDVKNWYDQGVDFLRPRQTDNGSFQNDPTGGLNVWTTTALSTLFLVRSSEILIQPISTSLLNGGIGFPQKGVLRLKNGQVQSQAAIKGVADLMELLGESDGEDAQALLEATKITASSIGEGMSRGQRLALLSGMVKERSWTKRMIAVKVLAGEQNMDNVPALLYALGDPNLEVAREAHNGLRLISRRIDAFPLSEKPDYTEFQVLKRRWTEWFLSIRPDAELIED